MQERISLDEATICIGAVLAGTQPLIERIGLEDALGRTLAVNVQAPFALPRFANSAMDGYALRASELQNASAEHPVRLPLAWDQRAGTVGRALPIGSVVQISTGAVLPEGADSVVILEDCTREETAICFQSPVLKGQFVRAMGEEFAANAEVLRAGTCLGVAHLALAASFGLSELRCYAKPRVAVLANGSELVDSKTASSTLAPGQIYDANRILLRHLISASGASTKVYPLMEDSRELIRDQLLLAAESADLVISTGGASTGPADFLPSLLREIGHVYFWRVRIKPGMPALFGEIHVNDRAVPVFALPGNPVSVFSTFLMLARPALALLSGRSPAPLTQFFLPLAQPLTKTHARREFLRAVYREGALWPLGAQESHRLSSLIGAEYATTIPQKARLGLIDLPEEKQSYPAGALVPFLVPPSNF